jgi:ribosomal protein S18 acetylase RimI-like enzyme
MGAALIRPATLSDIPAIDAIERAAGRLFSEIGMDDVAAHEPAPPDMLAEYVRGGRAWVGEVDGDAVGYALADVVDGHGHMEQLSVHPDFGRRGIGRALTSQVLAWAQQQNLDLVTLLTFRDVPWNRPYYESLGFRVMPDEYSGSGIARLRRHEDAVGMRRETRCVMCLELERDTGGGHHDRGQEQSSS